MSEDFKKTPPGKKEDVDLLFSGRGSPALMSLKEPALRLLSEKYSERFAITRGEGERVHLFVIKFSLWGLVRTFVPKDLNKDAQTIGITDSLQLIEAALTGKNPKILESLEMAVPKALARIGEKSKSFS
jgi:hypothetical protein